MLLFIVLVVLLVFKSVPDCIKGIPGHYGMLRGIMGCSRGVPGLFRAVPGCSGGCSGVFQVCSGFYRHPVLTIQCTKNVSGCLKRLKHYKLNKVKRVACHANHAERQNGTL